jgi:hypothetical protein
MVSDPKAAVTLGRDFNFFQKLSISQTTTFGADCDVVITFSTQSVMLLNLGTGVVEFSFNGNTVHGELNSANPSAGLTFDNRVISKIWFRVQSGSTPPINVSVMAWGTR